MAEIEFNAASILEFNHVLYLLKPGEHARIPEISSLAGPLSLEPKIKHLVNYVGNRRIVMAEFTPSTCRGMDIYGASYIEDLVSTHLKDLVGNAKIIISADSKEAALAFALKISKCFPLYSRKSDQKTTVSRVLVDFMKFSASPLLPEMLKIDLSELNSLSSSIRLCQRLVDTPCAEMHSQTLVKECLDTAEYINKHISNVSVSVKVISDDLEKEGYGGIYNVGKAASNPPALVVLSYSPSSATKSICFVGKGIVYDTGGLSLKSTAGMCSMKQDMGGSAACLSAFRALCLSGYKQSVHAIMCIAENAIGPNALRNDDIITLKSGKTVEINNTDAEGRLVLGDGVFHASHLIHPKPDLIVDVATLTGAQLIATGIKHAGILTPKKETEDRAMLAGETSGDLVFPLLYARELLFTNFSSVLADMKNASKERHASSSCAGHFVESHLDPEYKGEWLHVDIAGPAAHKDRATGFGVGFLYCLAKQYE